MPISNPDTTIAQCATAIKEIGFPIFVAIYLLVIHSKILKDLTHAINSLTRAFERSKITFNDTP